MSDTRDCATEWCLMYHVRAMSMLRCSQAEGSDPKTKRVYFYNKITKKTQWSKPECMGGSDAKPAASSAAAAKKSVVTSESEEEDKPAVKAVSIQRGRASSRCTVCAVRLLRCNMVAVAVAGGR